MHFCRRCGQPLTQKMGHIFTCGNSHTLYVNAASAPGLLLLNAKGQVLLVRRAIEPGKGMLDVPGGFCDGPEPLEDALVREMHEELDLSPADYSTPEFMFSDTIEYEFSGERIPLLVEIFRATINPNAKPKPKDDVVSIEWALPAEVDLNQVAFSAVRIALQKLQKQ